MVKAQNNMGDNKKKQLDTPKTTKGSQAKYGLEYEVAEGQENIVLKEERF